MKVERTYTEEKDKLVAVLLAGLKTHLRLTTNAFNDNLSILLEAAFELAEKETGCVFLPSTFTITSKGIIDKGGFFPAFEVTSVKLDGVAGDVDDVYVSEGRIYIARDEGTEIEVTFDAGYLSIPKPVIIAVYMVAGAMFNSPMDHVEQLPKASTNILKNYRRWQR